MSAEPLRVALPTPPAAAALCAGGWSSFVERRLTVARAQGERDACERAARALDAAVERLERSREEAAAQLARNAVTLAVEIARTLVRVEVDAGRHGLEDMVREALAASGAGRGPCQVHLNPRDLAQLSGARFRSGTVLEADDAVARGDVQVSAPHGLLVRETSEALRSIHERLLGELT